MNSSGKFYFPIGQCWWSNPRVSGASTTTGVLSQFDMTSFLILFSWPQSSWMVLSLQKSTFWLLLLALQWLFRLFWPFLAFGGALLIRYHQALVGFLHGFFDGCLATYYFLNFGGDLLLGGFNIWWRSTLVKFCFWWSFVYGGVLLHTAFSFCPVVGISFLLLLLLCSPVRCGGAMGIVIVQFTQQCSSVSKSLTCYA